MPPVGAGLYLSGLGLNGNVVTGASVSRNPYSTPVLPIWFEIQTYGGLPLKSPVPPRTCVF